MCQKLRKTLGGLLKSKFLVCLFLNCFMSLEPGSNDDIAPSGETEAKLGGIMLWLVSQTLRLSLLLTTVKAGMRSSQSKNVRSRDYSPRLQEAQREEGPNLDLNFSVGCPDPFPALLPFSFTHCHFHHTAKHFQFPLPTRVLTHLSTTWSSITAPMCTQLLPQTGAWAQPLAARSRKQDCLTTHWLSLPISPPQLCSEPYPLRCTCATCLLPPGAAREGRGKIKQCCSCSTARFPAGLWEH